MGAPQAEVTHVAQFIASLVRAGSDGAQGLGSPRPVTGEAGVSHTGHQIKSTGAQLHRVGEHLVRTHGSRISGVDGAGRQRHTGVEVQLLTAFILPILP